MFVILWMLVTLFSSASASCIRDNCLRAFRATNPVDQYQSAVEFCSTFTTSTITATASIPTFAATPCANNIARVSSACSCMPTPIATTAACQQLVQNGDFSEGPLQSTDIPHWVVTPDNLGHYVFYETQDFGGAGNDNFWTKWENDYGPQPSTRVSISLAQGFSRCVGIPYQLSIGSFYVHGYYDYENYPNQLPITFQVTVGFNGSTPITTRKIVYPNIGRDTSEPGSSGELLMLVPPLTAPPAPGTDGVTIVLSDSYGGQMELIMYNVTMTAMSN